MTNDYWYLDPDRFFSPNPAQRFLARDLYQSIKEMPIVSPHGHIDPSIFVDERFRFSSPANLFIIPDHYIFRMLYSQGIPLEKLGVQAKDGQDHREIWQVFADNFYLFRGTPSGIWFTQELIEVFEINERLSSENAQDIYDEIQRKLDSPQFNPRALFERFNIEVLCTTDAVTSKLEHHQAIRDSGWNGDIRPTFRADSVFDITAPNWLREIEKLGELVGKEIVSFKDFIRALEKRRAFFIKMGAVATDQAAISAYTKELNASEVEIIFQRALKGKATHQDATQFMGHMVMESARMSIEDGLVMQFRVGSVRNYDQNIYERFGSDKGFDIPEQGEFTHNLRPLLQKFGSNPHLTLIIFSLDEACYSRELAPLAGVYPAVKLGPPWWFFDSVNGIGRYFETVMETAGLYNTVGFNDDTRAFPSIPARHDVWRRSSANWVAGLVVRGILDLQDAQEMVKDLAYQLVRKAYRF
ncbi:MAG: glucuronate isomerase [Anaerolineales bacterium]|nr:glucuronate isomerase [Anaerolineales bacterium]